MAAPQDTNPELETFREQWRAEVRARNTAPSTAEQQQQQQQGNTFIREEIPRAKDPEPPRPPHLGPGKPSKINDKDDDDDYVLSRAFDDPEPTQPVRQEDKQRGEPVTAMDHYERAVEKEAAGSLGDSLSLYRKAFRVRANLRGAWCTIRAVFTLTCNPRRLRWTTE